MDEPDQSSPGQHEPSGHGQEGKADELTRKRVDTHQELGKRAAEAEDHDGGNTDPADPGDRDAPAQEQ